MSHRPRICADDLRSGIGSARAPRRASAARATARPGLDQPGTGGHPDVWLVDVCAGYGDRVVLENVNLAVEAGTLLAVVGPNGAGKSTLLKLMAGLLAAVAGRIEVLGGPAGRRRGAWPTSPRPSSWTGRSRSRSTTS